MNDRLKGIAAQFASAVFAVVTCCVTLHAASPPSADQEVGKSIYEMKCASCHGKEGRGNGAAAAFLNPRPRDFTSGKFKVRSTESGSIPTDDDLRSTIQNGLHGSAMADWKNFLHGDSLEAVIAYVKSLSARFTHETPKPVRLGATVPTSASSLAAGKQVYDKLQCASCHGTDGKGTDAVATDLHDDWQQPIAATNLTEPWTFRGGSTAKDIYMRFRTGIDGSPMPSYVGTASENEMWNLANYVVSLRRKPLWEMNEQEVKDFYQSQKEVARKNPVEWGKHMVSSLGCAFCHSPIREDGSIVEEMRLAGGERWDLYPFGEFVTYNLTSDKETGLGGWTDDQIKTFLRTGTRRDGTRMLPFPMPWPAYATLSDDDLNAIVAYLRTVPPVYNKIPLPKKPNIFSYLWGKFQVLILKKDIPGYVYPGNAGTTKPVAARTNPSHQLLTEAGK